MRGQWESWFSQFQLYPNIKREINDFHGLSPISTWLIWIFFSYSYRIQNRPHVQNDSKFPTPFGTRHSHFVGGYRHNRKIKNRNIRENMQIRAKFSRKKLQEKKTQKGNSYAVIKFTDLGGIFEQFIFLHHFGILLASITGMHWNHLVDKHSVTHFRGMQNLDVPW